jgi:hypothetical protein
VIQLRSQKKQLRIAASKLVLAIRHRERPENSVAKTLKQSLVRSNSATQTKSQDASKIIRLKDLEAQVRGEGREKAEANSELVFKWKRQVVEMKAKVLKLEQMLEEEKLRVTLKPRTESTFAQTEETSAFSTRPHETNVDEYESRLAKQAQKAKAYQVRIKVLEKKLTMPQSLLVGCNDAISQTETIHLLNAACSPEKNLTFNTICQTDAMPSKKLIFTNIATCQTDIVSNKSHLVANDASYIANLNLNVVERTELIDASCQASLSSNNVANTMAANAVCQTTLSLVELVKTEYVSAKCQADLYTQRAARISHNGTSLLPDRPILLFEGPRPPVHSTKADSTCKPFSKPSHIVDERNLAETLATVQPKAEALELVGHLQIKDPVDRLNDLLVSSAGPKESSSRDNLINAVANVDDFSNESDAGESDVLTEIDEELEQMRLMTYQSVKAVDELIGDFNHTSLLENGPDTGSAIDDEEFQRELDLMNAMAADSVMATKDILASFMPVDSNARRKINSKSWRESEDTVSIDGDELDRELEMMKSMTNASVLASESLWNESYT